MDLKIKKAKLTKGSTIEATFIDEDGNEITMKGKNTVHVDLKARLAALIPYFAELTEQKEADHYDWNHPDSAENLVLMRRLDVTGVSLGGDDNYPVATLTGRRTLMSSKVLNLNTPPVDLDSSDNLWIRAEDFSFAIDAFFYEVKLYVTDKKWAAKQSEINFEDEDDPFANANATEDVESVTDTDAPKGTSGDKVA